MKVHEMAREIADAMRHATVDEADRYVESMIAAKAEMQTREFTLLVFEVCRLLSGNDRELVGAMLTKKVERLALTDKTQPEDEQDSEDV